MRGGPGPCACGPFRSSGAGLQGASRNPATFWGRDHRDRIGWQPQDTAEDYRTEVGHILSGDPVEERYQGGGYTSIEYSRSAPSPRDPFALD